MLYSHNAMNTWTPQRSTPAHSNALRMLLPLLLIITSVGCTSQDKPADCASPVTASDWSELVDSKAQPSWQLSVPVNWTVEKITDGPPTEYQLSPSDRPGRGLDFVVRARHNVHLDEFYKAVLQQPDVAQRRFSLGGTREITSYRTEGSSAGWLYLFEAGDWFLEFDSSDLPTTHEQTVMDVMASFGRRCQ